MANLICWRHAEAEVDSKTGADIDRELTKQGRKDAATMAKWLHQHLPANTEVLCSPARRCLETAAALQRFNRQQEVTIAEYLGVENSVDKISKHVLNEDSSRTILIIGHQPNLGLLIARLLKMENEACVVKKGAVWWLRQRHIDDTVQTYLFTVQHPDLV
ncbi:MAG: phosphohistidine phosphatase [Methylotenera sp.]|nr:MAG: phosphohistidine phosphatase [Methylotenera sp.]